jgi:DNA-binding NtrC family response regulator
MARATRSTPSATTRPVLYQLGRLADRFVPGDVPVDLSARPRPLLLCRKEGEATPEAGRIFVDDPWMSSQHARSGDGGRPPTLAGAPTSQRLFIEDLGSKNGVVVNGTASSRAPLLHGDIIETGRTFWVYVEERLSEPVLSSAVEVGAFVTWHPRLGAQLGELVARAPGPEHALISGPDGSGKGFLARTLHQVSRRDGRFLHLDCAERRPRKLAVELFGKDGVAGRLHDAARGSLLLEHIDTMPLELQLRLADALRRRTIPGDGRARAIEARVIATCSTPPRELVARGVLDKGLVDALAGIQVDLLPLHERLCDLGLLLDDFLTRAKGATSISREACRVLFRHRFGQHVRGFARVVEAAASLAVEDGAGKKGVVSVEHLPFSVAGTDAMRLLLQKAQHLAVAGVDNPELTSHEIPVLSATGPDGAVLHDSADHPHDDHHGDNAFSSVVETDAEQSRPDLPSSPRRRGTASVIEADVFADVEDVDADAVTAALRAARGNVAAAARALGRPRALVLRWCRDLGLDPLAFR